MFVRVLISCFAAFLLMSKGEAFSFLPIDVVNLEATKGVMSQGFQLEYRGLLTTFISEWLYALQNAATELRAALSADDANYAKYTVIIDGAVQQRAILEDGGSLNNDKLTGILVTVKGLWEQLHGLNPETGAYQSHLDRVQQAWNTLCQVVVTAWSHAGSLVGLVGASKLDGFDSLNADILKVKDTQVTAENNTVFTGLMSRILAFFGVDASLNVSQYITYVKA